MPIGCIESVTYGVADLAAAAQFYDDFGLRAIRRAHDETIYRLEEGSRVILRLGNDPNLPAPHYDGNGVRLTTFSISSREELDNYARRLSVDREVARSEDGNTIHFAGPEGIALALTVWERSRVTYSPDPVNAPDNVKRLNQHRRWHVRAHPKTINHIVWRVKDIDNCMKFFCERLDFRLTDTQTGAGQFVRAPGANQHHSAYFQKFDALPPYTVGFDHVAFGVEDIDEVYAGMLYMHRRGYTSPLGGVGRHRIASALFCYFFNNPCGGMSEYGADTDYLDDNWVPRVWEARFGGFTWTSQLQPFLPEELEWKVAFNPANTPNGSIPTKSTKST